MPELRSTPAPVPLPDDPRAASSRYSAYVVGLLCLVNAFNFGDRILISIVQEQLRAEFRLSDLDIGLLGGTAFATLYVFMSFPIARLAERGNRAIIVTAALATWSAMTMLGGLANSYVQLFLTRMGVSIGEAGCAPPSHSLISDYFAPEQRAKALATYAVGAPLGSLLMAVAGGAVAQAFGWRAALVAAGAGGLVLTALAGLTLREPRRAARKPIVQTGFRQTVRTLMTRRSFIHVCLAGAVSGFGATFIMQYTVSFLMRAHGLPIGTAAGYAGLTGGVAIIIGQIGSAVIVERRIGRNPLALHNVTIMLQLASIVFFLFAFAAPKLAIAIACLFVASMLQGNYLGQAITVVQNVAPANMRATASAIFIFTNSALAFGLGPPLFGAVSDFAAGMFRPAVLSAADCAILAAPAECVRASASGLRVALLAASLTPIWAAVHFWFSRRSYLQDTAQTDEVARSG